MAGLADAALGSIPDPGGERAEESLLVEDVREAGLRDAELRDADLLPDDVRDAREPEGLAALDGRLTALCRERGPLRAILTRIA